MGACPKYLFAGGFIFLFLNNFYSVTVNAKKKNYPKPSREVSNSTKAGVTDDP